MESKFTLKNYQIGEFAKRMGVSPHFLKYYEESGILTPKTHQNRYRFYNLWDASIVFECKKMKNLGFSVKESRKITTDSTAVDLEQMLALHENQMSHEIKQKQLSFQAIQNLRADLKLCQDQEWKIGTTQPLWFLPHTQNQCFADTEGLYQHLEHWVNAMPIVRSTQRLTLHPEKGWLAEWGFSIAEEHMQALGLEAVPPAVRLAPAKVFEQYTNYTIHYGTVNEQHEQEYQKVLNRVCSLNLTPGTTLLKEVVAYTLKNGVRQVYCILRVPVTEKEN